ncbi:transglycosylase domain-containing protein [Pendulispora rubella]|uniref:Transglycosylase domain-containing protein n=1 Tax=Pendulispora rubella TaxID=2741070 RepID=A0ABZ2L0T8_9BACT
MLRRLRDALAAIPTGIVRWVLLSVAGVGLVVVLSFPPLMRGRVKAVAEKRGLEVGVGSIRPGWFALKLSDVDVRPEGTSGARATLSQVEISLDMWLRPKKVAVVGGHVEANGALDDLEKELDAWRARHPSKGAGAPTGKRLLEVTADALSIAWNGGADGVEGSGIALARDEDGMRVTVPELHAHHDGWSVELSEAGARFSKQGALAEAQAARVAVELAAPAPMESSTKKPASAPAEPPPAPTQREEPGPRSRRLASARAKGSPPPPPDPAQDPTPLLSLPDLHAMRTRLGLLAKGLAKHWEPEATLHVEGLSFRWGRDADRLTVGPGPVSVARRGDRLAVEFSTNRATESHSGTPLSLRGDIPLERGDMELSLAGGPVALAPLGVKEGAGGLTDVGRGTLSGKGSLVLSDAGDALAFDIDVGAKDLSISNPKLADDVVRGLAISARARGALNDKGLLRIDDAQATLGALRVAVRGTLEQTGSHALGSLSFAVPQAQCQALFESIPGALLPTLSGAAMKGTFGGKGQLQFDSRKLDDLLLDYDFDNLCKLTVVPQEIDHGRFTKPFLHQVYHPDGTVGQEETGPGTEAWTELGAISPFLQVAVLTTEDGAFFRHHGFNHRAIRDSLIANLKARRFVRGASTITMQLAKNLFLSREKTLSRKFEEVILASYLEQNFSKQEIMELYLNVVEFGPDVYGVGHASEHYFGRKPEEIHLPEAFFLSSLLPRPLAYHKTYERGELSESWTKSIRFLMETAFKRGTISRGELDYGLSETLMFHKPEQPRPPPRSPVIGSRLFEQSIQK